MWESSPGKRSIIFQLNMHTWDLPGASGGGGDGWQPTRTIRPPSRQMGQSSAIPNGDFLSLSNNSMVALHAECGVDDRMGGERGNSGPAVDMIDCWFLWFFISVYCCLFWKSPFDEEVNRFWIYVLWLLYYNTIYIIYRNVILWLTIKCVWYTVRVVCIQITNKAKNICGVCELWLVLVAR